MTVTAERPEGIVTGPGRPGARSRTSRPIGGLGIWVTSEWRSRWRALLGIAVVVALGGGITTATIAGARRADSAFDRFLSTIGAPISLTANANPLVMQGGGFSDEFVQEVASLPGVRGVMPGTWLGVALQSAGEPLYFFSMGLGATLGENPPAAATPRRGRLPDPAAVDEVAINEAAARAIGAGVGDTIELRTYGADQMGAFLLGNNSPDHGPRIDVRVVGVVRLSSDIGDSAEPMALLSSGFVERHRNDIASCRCGMFVNAASRDVTEVVAEIEGITSGRDVYVRAEDTKSVALVDDAIGVEVGSLWIAAAIAALAGLFVVVQALGRHIAAAGAQRSSLQAIGATRSAVVRAWTLMFAPVAVAGAIGAVVIATAASPLFPRGLARTAEPELGVRVDGPTLLVGATVIIVGVLALAAAVAWRATAPAGVRHAASHERRGAVWAASLPPTARLGINLALDPARDRGRIAFVSAVASIGAAIAGTLAIGLIERSTSEVMSTPAAYGSDWNYSLTQAPQDPDAVMRATMELPVDAVAFQSTVAGMSFVTNEPSETVAFTVLAFDSLVGSIGPLIDEGRPISRADDVVISQHAANRLGVGVGDELVFEPSGQVFHVSGLGRTNFDEPDSAAVVSIDGLRRLASDGEPQLLAAHLRTSDIDDATIDRLHRIGWSDSRPPASIGNLDQIGSVPRLLGIALGVLGLAGLLNALLVGLGRRRGDLATVRALGFTSRQIVATVVWQALTVAGAAIAIGAPLGVLLGRLVWKRIVDSVGAVDLVTLPWAAAVVVPGAAIVVVVLVGLAVGRRAARIRPADVLRCE